MYERVNLKKMVCYYLEHANGHFLAIFNRHKILVFKYDSIPRLIKRVKKIKDKLQGIDLEVWSDGERILTLKNDLID